MGFLSNDHTKAILGVEFMNTSRSLTNEDSEKARTKIARILFTDG